MGLFSPDYYVSRESVTRSIADESLFNLIHQGSVIKVDCIVRKNTPYQLAEFERRQRITIEGFSTWIASKEDLIISKSRTIVMALCGPSGSRACGLKINPEWIKLWENAKTSISSV